MRVLSCRPDESLVVCQHEDCRVQMWGCKKVKVDEDPRGHDVTWDPYSVLDSGKHGANFKEACAVPLHPHILRVPPDDSHLTCLQILWPAREDLQGCGQDARLPQPPSAFLDVALHV